MGQRLTLLGGFVVGQARAFGRVRSLVCFIRIILIYKGSKYLKGQLNKKFKDFLTFMN